MSALTRNRITLVSIAACSWLFLSASANAQFDAPPPPPSLSEAVGEEAEDVVQVVQSELQEAPPALPVGLQSAPAVATQAVVSQPVAAQAANANATSLARPKLAPVKRSQVQSLAKTRSPAVPSTARRPFISRLIRSRQSRYPYGAPQIRTTVALPKTTAESLPKIEQESSVLASRKPAVDKKLLQEKFGTLPVVTTKAELKSVASRTSAAQEQLAQEQQVQEQQVQPAAELQESKIQSVLRQPAGVVDPLPGKQPVPTVDPVMAFAKPIRDPGAALAANELSVPSVQSPAIQLASYEEVPVHSVSQPVTCANGYCDLAPAGAPFPTTGAHCSGCDALGGCDASGGCQDGSCGPLGCGGLCGRIGGCLADLATPTFAMPLGSSVNAFMDAQVSNAAKVQSVMYHYDFADAHGVHSAQLKEAGKRKLKRITASGMNGFPIMVQPVPGRPDISEARRSEVENFIVSQLGYTGSQVVVAEPEYRGLRGVEAVETDRNQLQNTRSFGSLGGGSQLGGSSNGGTSQQQSQGQTQRR